MFPFGVRTMAAAYLSTSIMHKKRNLPSNQIQFSVVGWGKQMGDDGSSEGGEDTDIPSWACSRQIAELARQEEQTDG